MHWRRRRRELHALVLWLGVSEAGAPWLGYCLPGGGDGGGFMHSSYTAAAAEEEEQQRQRQRQEEEEEEEEDQRLSAELSSLARTVALTGCTVGTVASFLLETLASDAAAAAAAGGGSAEEAEGPGIGILAAVERRCWGGGAGASQPPQVTAEWSPMWHA
jgi:hypothetical protein